MMKLNEALAELDPLDDDHWTGDGLPRMDVLIEKTDDAELTRKLVTEAAPLFTREKPTIDLSEDDEVTDDEVTDDEVTDDEVTDLRAEQAELKEKEMLINEGMERAKDELKKIHARLDQLHDQLLVIDPPMTNAERIRAFINQSNADRAKRHADANTIIANLPKGVADPRAPIDRAFGRGNKRGAARPLHKR